MDRAVMDIVSTTNNCGQSFPAMEQVVREFVISSHDSGSGNSNWFGFVQDRIRKMAMKAFLTWCRKYPLRSVPFLAMFGGLAIAIGLIDPINIPLIITYLLLAGFFGFIIWKDSGGAL